MENIPSSTKPQLEFTAIFPRLCCFRRRRFFFILVGYGPVRPTVRFNLHPTSAVPRHRFIERSRFIEPRNARGDTRTPLSSALVWSCWPLALPQTRCVLQPNADAPIRDLGFGSCDDGSPESPGRERRVCK